MCKTSNIIRQRSNSAAFRLHFGQTASRHNPTHSDDTNIPLFTLIQNSLKMRHKFPPISEIRLKSKVVKSRLSQTLWWCIHVACDWRAHLTRYPWFH